MTLFHAGLLGSLLVAVLTGTVWAHKPSDSYLSVYGDAEFLSARWDISLKDLDYVIGLDANANGEITWGELKSQRSALAAYALSRLQFTTDGAPCQLTLSDLMVTQHSDGAYAVLMLATTTPGSAKSLHIQYSLFFDVDPTHRGLVSYRHGEMVTTHVLAPDSPATELCATEPGYWSVFVDYVHEGVWHIWIGYDHILFLLSLLLPAVLKWRDRRWTAVDAFGPVCWSVLKVVTMFTLAHSITLWLAVMDYVTLPSQLVETAIAFSIVVTAVNNLFPILPLSSWGIAFLFGLVHGFGFANVLSDLGLRNVTLAISLLAFNVGVEFGQSVIVLVFLPMAYLLRGTPFYQWVLFRGGSVVVLAIALVWMCERAFHLKMIGS